MDQSAYARLFGNFIRSERLKRELTQRMLSQASGISIRHMKSIESGDRIPSLEVLDRLIEALQADREKVYTLYLPLISSRRQCAEYILWCWDRKMYIAARKGAKKLLDFTKNRRINVENVDLIIIFIDNNRE